MINQFAIAITTIIFNKTALSIAGDYGVSAVSIIMYMQFLFLGIYNGYSQGLVPLLSQEYGHHHYQKRCDYQRDSYYFFIIVPILSCVISYLSSDVLVSFFAQIDHPVYSIATHGMKLYSLTYICAGLNIFTAYYFSAFGYGHYGFWITLLRPLVLLMIFLLILPHHLGMNGLWLATPMAEMFTCFITIIMNIYINKTLYK